MLASMRGVPSSWPDRGARVACLGFAVAALHTGHGSSAPRSSLPMSVQGQVLEIRVTGCRKLWDTEFFSRQVPYIIVEYPNIHRFDMIYLAQDQT